MKAKVTIRKWLSVGFGVVVVIAWGSLTSCEKTPIHPQNSELPSEKSIMSENLLHDYGMQTDFICGTVMEKTLAINLKEKVGKVKIYNDAHFLYIDAVSFGKHSFANAYLFAGELTRLPMNDKGDLLYEEFNHINRVRLGAMEPIHRFKISLKGLNRNSAMALMVVVNPLTESKPPIIQSWALGVDAPVHGNPKIFDYSSAYCPVDESIEVLGNGPLPETKYP
jgi:hypothetical protein